MSDAHGFLETRGLVASMVAADAMAKAADIRLHPAQFVGDGLVTVSVTGEVAAVMVAVEAGEDAATEVGEVVSRHVIALPFVDPRLSDRGTTSAVTGAAASGRTDAARRRPTADNTTTSKASQETSQQRSPKGTDKESKDG